MKAEYVPLRCVKAFEKQYPGIYQKYDEEMKKRSDGQLEYDIIYKLVKDAYGRKYTQEKQQIISIILSVYAQWRIAKQVYTFSPILCEMLCNTENFKIESSFFQFLPHRTFYVEIDPNHESAISKYGIFIKYVKDEINNNIIFVIAREDCGYTYFCFDVKDNADFMSEVDKHVQRFETENDRAFLKQCLVFGFQAAMYLCAENCDISENENQKKVYHPGAYVKDRYAEIRKWDIGYREVFREEKPELIMKGYSKEKYYVRQTSEEKNECTNKKHYTLRQHVRRAHWHTYLVGKGRKEKVLKFINEIIVNNINDEMPIVNHIGKDS